MRSFGEWLAGICLASDPPRPVEHRKMFQVSERSEVAEELAAHTLRHAYPGVGEIRFEWVHHNQPEYWLLFAIGEET